jgi:pyrrolidone-carboxylate peptidase
MPAPLILLTGFGPFLEVEANPSGLVVEALLAAPPAGLRLAGGVLPVSIAGVPAAYDALLAAAGERPAALVSLGVHSKGFYRLEQCARAGLFSKKRDNDGLRARGVRLDGAARMETTFDLARLAAALSAAGAPDVRISKSAGGFVCERAYHHVLTRAAELAVPGLFLHVPPLAAAALEVQSAAVAALLQAVTRAVSA